MIRSPLLSGLRRRPRFFWLGVNAAVLAAGLLAAAACMGTRQGVAADSRPVPLAEVGPATAGGLAFRGAIEVTGTGARSLSGLVVDDSGRRFTAVSDNGKLVRGRLLYDEAGRLAGAADLSVRTLPGTRFVTGRPRRSDSEDLARLPDGGWLVSFERDHRIERYGGGGDGPSGSPTELPPPPGLEDAPFNGGIEALAALPDGRVLALEEGDDNGRPERRGWIGQMPLSLPRAWQPVTYRAAPGFRPTGAAALPSGDVLVLERRVSLLGGWGGRITRVPAASLRPGATLAGTTLVGEEMARLESPLPADNYEGISAVTGPRGETLVFVVSDDNTNPLQRTLLLMFAMGGE
ncbi:esterase-like activity of phytase family protein [Azospirillum sp.]|uniref:esterase-like activity of phytase family protein n=1 Tax=Azospirillum sp. TaxID=34012 RepID=UPI002D2311DB|nr:esterase-like activity of phytase family protein [Azospirillum sp.]HYD63920.1 esterase-like activity of phytase family protein [Azospirillum sp.]